MKQIAITTLVVLLISRQLIAADKPDLSSENLARIKVDGEKLASEVDGLQKSMAFLLNDLRNKLSQKYMPEADALSEADKSSLAKYLTNKIMVSAYRSLLLALRDEIDKNDVKPASQPDISGASELRLLRIEVARLREENQQLSGGGADKAKAEAHPADGDGFEYTRLHFQTDSQLPKLIGEVTNKSGKDYSFATFKVSLYDANREIMGTVDVLVPNLRNGQSKSYDGMLLSIDIAKIKSYKIQFQSGI